MKPPPGAPRFLYHVTFASKLDDGIAEEGLDADRGSTFGGGYAGHTRGRIFLCDAGAVECWWGKIEDQANHHFEGREIVDGNHVPVILRTAVTTERNPSGLDWGDLEVDEIGSNDCIGGTSYFVEDQAIDVTWLQVWDGRQWLDVEGARADEIASAYIVSAEEHQDEDDEDVLPWTDVEMAIPPGWDVDEPVRQENPTRTHAALPLAEVERWEPLAASLGVSEVARGREGFLGAYKAAKGRLTALSPYWRARREGFLARHLAQAAHEPLFRAGQPTRRHLALVMWAYSPEATRLRRSAPSVDARRSNPVPRRRMSTAAAASLASELADYLNITVDPYDFAYLLPEWDTSKDDDAQVEDLSEEELERFGAWLQKRAPRERESMPLEVPSYLYFEDARPLGPRAWLVHFGKVHFANFDRGATLEQLGLSAHLIRKTFVDCERNLSRETPSFERVYGFAFEADVAARHRRAWQKKYGEKAVLFQTDAAILAYHNTDDETQAVFPLCSERNVHAIDFDEDGSVRLDDAASFASLQDAIRHLEAGAKARLPRRSKGPPSERVENPATSPRSCPAQGPVFERDATLEEVERDFVRSFEAGRHGKKPDAATMEGLRAKGPRWVLAKVPLQLLSYQREPDEVSGERMARAREYASRLTRNVPPGIAFYGERSQRQRTLRAYVKDGNHRALAHELAGKPLVKMWMPKDEFDALQRQATGFA